LKIFSPFRIFEQLVLALKHSCPEIFHCIEYTFYHSGFLSNLRLPCKTELPRIFHCLAPHLATPMRQPSSHLVRLWT